MRARVLPDPDAYATCPLDGKILGYYTGVFEAVFVSLNPFIRAVSINICDFTTGTWPDRPTLVESCSKVAW